MNLTHLHYQITDETTRLDFPKIHDWLTHSYWSPGISLQKIQQAAQHSALVISAHDHSLPNQPQVAYARVISDRTRFAWIADVFVDPVHRGKALAQQMVRFALEHPTLADVNHWMLATWDAHTVYAKLGFQPPDRPDRLMQLKKHLTPKNTTINPVPTQENP